MGFHIGQIRDPQPVRGWCFELAFNKIRWPLETIIGDGGDLERFAPTSPGEAHVTHQPLDGAAGNPNVLPVELGPDLVGAIHEEVLVEHPLDLDLQLLITNSPRRRRPVLGNVIGVRGDPDAMLTQDVTDRLDPEPVPMGINKGHYFFDWRSSSAPKKAEAARLSHES